MPAESQRDRLPFEPTKKREKPVSDSQKQPETAKKPAKQSNPKKPHKIPSSTVTNPKKTPATEFKQAPPYTKEEMAVPKVVSDRMARRMALFCGVPTFLGIASFIISYVIVSQGWFKLPNVAVLLVSMGFLGLGVLGLTYGVLSASWDEEALGSMLGWQEFKMNWGRMTAAWRSTRQNK